MSMIAIGGTLAVGGAVSAGTVAAGAALAGTALNYMGQKKALKAQQGAMSGLNIDPRAIAAIIAGVEEYQPVNVGAVVSDTANKNAGEGVNLANRSAKKLNEQAVNDVLAAMAKMYGGKEKYESERTTILGNIDSKLAGQVSSSTRDELGRNLLRTGVTDLGDGATSDTMAGYLGLTKEGLQAQGQEQWQSLYRGFRESLPLINGSQILDRFTIAPDNAVQAEIQNAQNAYQSSMGLAGLKMQGLQLGYQGNYNQAMAAADLARGKANSNAALVGNIASAVGTVAGAYAGSPSKAPAINTSGPALTGTGHNISQQPAGLIT